MRAPGESVEVEAPSLSVPGPVPRPGPRPARDGRRLAARAPRAAAVGLLGLLGLLTVAACTAANPDFVDDGGAVVDLRRSGRDAVAAADCAMRPQPCFPGDRGCLAVCGASVSASCAGDALAIDRVCPPGSTCTAKGYVCQVPSLEATSPQGAGCTSESACRKTDATMSFTCAPFVVAPGKVDWRCALKLGDGASGDHCDDNAQCRSGFCIAALHTCFRYCSGSNMDCPQKAMGGTMVQLPCRPATIVVEGVSVTTTSCVLP